MGSNLKSNTAMRKFKENFVSNNAELAECLGMFYEETTIERSGYPRSLKLVITAESIQELMNAKNDLEKEGFEVSELLLHKQNGWNLWHREMGVYLEKGAFLKNPGNEWYYDYDSDGEESEIKEEIFSSLFRYDELLVYESEYRTYEKIKELTNHVDSFFSQLPLNQGETRVFYDPQDYQVRYKVTDDSAYYYNDTHHYQLAIMVESFEQEPKTDENDQ